MHGRSHIQVSAGNDEESFFLLMPVGFGDGDAYDGV